MDFTVSGHKVCLTASDVEHALVGVSPEVIRKHAVVVLGVEYPVKQVFSIVSGMDLLDFTTNQARHALSRLGFELRRVQ